RLARRSRGAVTGVTTSGSGELPEDPPHQLLVVLDVVLEDPQLAERVQVDSAKRLARRHAVEGQRLETGTARLGAIRDEDEVQRRPLPAGEQKDRPLAALVLHGDELFDRRPVLHLDEDVLAAHAVLIGSARGEIGREVLTTEAQRRPAGRIGLDLITG